MTIERYEDEEGAVNYKIDVGETEWLGYVQAVNNYDKLLAGGVHEWPGFYLALSKDLEDRTDES